MKPITKLNEKQTSDLMGLRAYYQASIADKDIQSAVAFKNQILGYLTALKTTEQITATDKEQLLIYFTKSASLK